MMTLQVQCHACPTQRPTLIPTLVLQVWRPSTLRLRLDDPTLNLIGSFSAKRGVADVRTTVVDDDLLINCSGGGARYQSSRLQLLADEVYDVTPLLGSSIAEVGTRVAVSGGAALHMHKAAMVAGGGRLLLEGTAPGAAAVWLRETPTVRLELNVSNEIATVLQLHAAAFSPQASRLSVTPLAAVGGGTERLEVHTELRQQLRAEGDKVSVVALAHMSDGAIMLVPHAELNVSSATDGLVATAPTVDGAPWTATVRPLASSDSP